MSLRQDIDLDARIASLPTQGPDARTSDKHAGNLFLLVLAAYFILQVVIRVTLTDSLAMDESEMALAYQQLRLGYGPQPPLYAWLSWGVFSTIGFSVLSMALLKNMLLFALYYCMFRLSKPLIGTACAVAATASLIFFLEISWDSQVDLTHTVLLTTIACATLWCYFAILDKPYWPRYVLMGVLTGLGVLSKYNYTVFIGGLAAASLLVQEHRKIIWNHKILIVPVIGLLCFLPHGLWLIDHLRDASHGTLGKMREGVRHGNYFFNLTRGFGSMILGGIGFVTPMWLIYAFTCRKTISKPTMAKDNANVRFFAWLYLVFFALMIVILLTGEVSNIKGRWLQHLLFPLPLVFFVVFPSAAQPQAIRQIGSVAAAFAIAILLIIPIRGHVSPMLGRYSRAHHPYAQLSNEIAQRFPRVKALVAGEKLMAGNLFFHRPVLPTFILDGLMVRHERLAGEVLLIWPGDKHEDEVGRYIRIYPASTIVQEGVIELPYRKSQRDTMSFRYALIDTRSN